jgi:hypothetical protein
MVRVGVRIHDQRKRESVRLQGAEELAARVLVVAGVDEDRRSVARSDDPRLVGRELRVFRFPVLPG